MIGTAINSKNLQKYPGRLNEIATEDESFDNANEHIVKNEEAIDNDEMDGVKKVTAEVIYCIAKNGDFLLNANWHAMSHQSLCPKHPPYKLREFESELIQDILISLEKLVSDLESYDIYQAYCNKCELHMCPKTALLSVLHSCIVFLSNHFVLDSTNDSENKRKDILSKMKNVLKSNPKVKHSNNQLSTDYVFLQRYCYFHKNREESMK